MTSLSRQLAAEAVGTAFLLMGVVGSGIMAERLAGDSDGLALLANTIATGAILTVLIVCLGKLSGAHFNPAVSLVMAMNKHMPKGHLLPFILTQILAAIVGVGLAHLMFSETIVQIAYHPRNTPGEMVAEGIATFGLVGTILACVRYRPDFVGPAVGLYITAGYWFTASTSFANPAVTIARLFTNTFTGISPEDTLAFIVAQLIGAVLAAWGFRWLTKETGNPEI